MSNLILIFYVLSTSAGLILIKMGAATGMPFALIEGKLRTNFNILNVSGLGFYALSFVLYVYLVSRFQLGYIVPVTAGLVYILVFTASFFIFKEPFTVTKIFGILLILIGLFLLNQDR